MKAKLSIICLTFNHVHFIRQALDGFVMQKTNFPFEVIIHDDASTDGTTDIIREYAEKYPDLIKPVYQTKNQYSQGRDVLKEFVFPKVQSKYVAMCEGDDYWTDENKLQQQVDFLDTHLDCSICFHSVRITYEDHSRPDSVFPKVKKWKKRRITTLKDLLKRNFVPTCSVVFRWRLKGQEQLFPTGICPGDWFLNLLHAQVGKIGYLPCVMSVYRRHSGGIWTGAGVSDNWFKKYALPHMKFYKMVEKQFDCNKSSEMTEMMFHAIQSLLRCKEWEKLQKLAELYPEIYQAVLTKDSKINSSEKYFRKYRKMKKIVFVLIGVWILTLVCLIFK